MRIYSYIQFSAQNKKDFLLHKKSKILTLLLLIYSFQAYTQPHQLSGFVRDKSSGDMLPNAYIQLDNGETTIAANSYGYFSIPVRKNTINLKVSFTGYVPYEVKLKLDKDTTIICPLEANRLIEEVEIKSTSAKQILSKEVGAIRLTGKEIERIPSLLGEHDLVKALQMMPGIKMGKEGSSGIYVRGGTPGQNLILLDDVPVYNVNHLFGYFSVFTPEAIKSVDVYKGAFPARYGGRISSVIDVKMKEGNVNKPNYDITIGTLSSKLIVELPVIKGKSSLLIAGRRTYFDLLLQPFMKTTSYDGKTTSSSGYNFYDLNAKLFYDAGKTGKFYISYYSGRDNYHSKSQTRNRDNESSLTKNLNTKNVRSTWNWGNFTTSLRWNKNIGKRMFANAALLYSNYSYLLEASNEEVYVLIDTIHSTIGYKNISKVNDIGAFVNFDYFGSDIHRVTFGSRVTYHRFVPSLLKTDEQRNDKEIFAAEIGSSTESIEINTFVEDHLKVTDKLRFDLGLHHSLYITAFNVFFHFQPRISASFEFGNAALKCSGGYMVQPVHNLSNNLSGLSVDIWVPSEAGIKPSSSLQFDLGYDSFFDDIYTLSLAGYVRKMQNILTYKSGETFFSLYDNWHQKVVPGNGSSYGVEIHAKKTAGKTTGWLGYTWSISNQQFSSLNNGLPFPAPHDRRHYFTISVSHHFSGHFQLSANWVFASGEPITISSTAYNGDNYYGKASDEIEFLGIFTKRVSAPDQIIYYPSVNNYRLPYYHRLDLGIDLKKEKKKGIRVWSFSVYNAYGRNNPFMVSVEDVNGKLVLKNSSPFRFFPSVSYRYTFK